MSRFSTMPRAYRQQLQATDQANVDRATQDATDHTVYATTLAGDSRKLRGIPAIGRSVRGAIQDTVPGDNLWR
jgi:hypothetical protein